MNSFLKLTLLCLVLASCNTTAYKDTTLKEKLYIGAMDVVSFGTGSDWIACLRKKGKEHPECQKLRERSLDYGRAWSGAAHDSLRYHYGTSAPTPSLEDETGWDWDYLAGSDQWRCRSTQTGRYAEYEHCYGKVMDDNRWPN